MKKVAFALTAVVASSAFAGELSVNSGIGASTNEVYRGYSMSDKNPSANADVRADFKGGPVDLFAGARGTTANVGGVRSVARGEVGVAKDFAGVHTEVGFRENMFFGGFGSDLNTREAFVRGVTGIGGGTLSAEYNKQVQGAEFGFGRPSYTSVGYSHAVDGTPLTLGASVGYAGYSTGTKFNDLTLTAAYKLTDRVDVLGTQTIGGTNVFGGSVPSQTSVGVRYAF